MFANESSTLNVSPQYFDTAPYGGGLSTGDFNNDGFIDILILVKRPALNWLYLNDGDGTFTARNTVCTINDYQEYWSAPLADFNGDGYLDIYFCRNDAPPDQEFGTALYMNDGGTNHWLQFNLEGVESNRSAIGARVTVYTGTRKQMRHVTGGGGDKTDSFTVR